MKPMPFAKKESKAEEAMEKRKFPGKKAYAKAERKFEGERYAAGGMVRGDGVARKGKTRGKMC